MAGRKKDRLAEIKKDVTGAGGVVLCLETRDVKYLLDRLQSAEGALANIRNIGSWPRSAAYKWNFSLTLAEEHLKKYEEEKNGRG